MEKLLSFLCIVLAGGSLAAAAVEPQTVEMTVYDDDDVTSLTGYGNCQWLYPLNEPNEALASEPKYASAKPVYYAAQYGDAADNVHTLVIDESGGTGSGYDTVYADLNNDNRLDPASEEFAFELGSTRHTEPVRLKLTVRAGGKEIPYSFQFSAFPYKDDNHTVEKVHANCRNSSIMVGEALFDGKRCKVALADLDSNGLFNDYEQGIFRGDRFFVDLDGDGEFRKTDAGPQSFSYARYAQIGGKWYTVEASPDGGTVRIKAAAPLLCTLKTVDCIRSVGLSAPKQYQGIEFDDDRAEAIAGTYELKSVSLELTDGDGQVWSTYGRYRAAGPKVTILPGVEAQLPRILPLSVRVDLAAADEGDVVRLEPSIVDAHGGTFSTLRKSRSRHEPPASLLIKDADGDIVVETKLEYG